MMPATCLGGVFAFAITAVFAPPPWPISGRDLALALLLGAGQVGLQYLLITFAVRWVPAAEIALLMLLEIVLAPLWVWLGVGEVLTALLGNGLLVLRRRLPTPAEVNHKS